MAVLTALPWVAALLMPDVLAPVVALSLFLLGLGRTSLSRREATYLTLLATLGIAAHLSHLPLALALVVVTLLLARAVRPALRVAAPLALAVRRRWQCCCCFPPTGPGMGGCRFLPMAAPFCWRG